MRFILSAGLYSLLAIVAVTAAAQDRGATDEHGAPAASPYAGMESRAIKALSDQQIADLAAGRGMGLALAAKLNGYPGPAHTLELADALMLSDKQRAETKALFDAMKAETIPIGRQLIVEETALDHLFRDREVTRASLDASLGRIGAAQTELRAAHLRYHLAMMDILSPPQIARYQELRGYAVHGLHSGSGMHPHAE